MKPWQAVAAAAIVGALGVGWGVARIKGVAGSREVVTIAAPAGPTKVAPAADAVQTAKEDATVLDRGQETPVQERRLHAGGAGRARGGAAAAAAATACDYRNLPPREDGGDPRGQRGCADHRAASRGTRRSSGRQACRSDDDDAAKRGAARDDRADGAKGAGSPARGAAPEKVAALPAEPAAQEAAAPSEPAAEPPASGSASVQFGAAPNETEARTLAKKVVQKYGSRLHGRKPTWKTAEVGGNTVYRVRVGGLSKEAATSLCKSVKSDGGDCYVAGN